MEPPTRARFGMAPSQLWILALSIAFLTFYALGLAIRPGEGYLRLQSNLLYMAPAIAALGLVVRRLGVADRTELWGWRFMACMLLTWILGDLMFSYYDLALDSEPPFPGTPDLLYTLGYASLLVALPLLAYPRRLVGNLRWLLDVMLIMTVVGAFEWVLIIQPLLDEGGSSTWESLVALSYPLWDLGLMTVIVGGMLAWHGNLAGRSMVLLAAMAVLAVTDSLYSYGLVEGTYDNVGNPLELGWIAAYMLIGYAATMPGNLAESRFDRRLPLFWMAFPYLLALPLPIVEGVRALGEQEVDVLSLGGAAVLLMAFLSHVHGSFMTTRALEDERRKARLDSLTGTLNHGGIVEEAETLIEASGDARLCACIVDVDRLKHINDAFGHRTGDLALKMIASRLRRSGGIVGRYGGDEFLILFEPQHCLDGETPELLLTRALTGAYVVTGDGSELPVNASFGLAVYPDEAGDLGALIETADAAMYEQKREKRRTAGMSAPPVATPAQASTQAA